MAGGYFGRLFVGAARGFDTKGAIELDARISEQFELSAESTDHPVDLHAIVSDHVILKPRIYILEGIVTDTPSDIAAAVAQIGQTAKNLATLQGSSLAGSLFAAGDGEVESKRSAKAFNQMIEVMQKREMIDVQTALGLWESLAIIHIAVTIDKDTANTLWFKAMCKEMRRVSVKEETLQASKLTGAELESGNSVTDEGYKQTKESRQSFLSSGASYLGFGK